MDTEGVDDPQAKGKSSDAETKMSTFEDLLELTGTRGPWNILMFCLCSTCQFGNTTERLDLS